MLWSLTRDSFYSGLDRNAIDDSRLTRLLGFGIQTARQQELLLNPRDPRAGVEEGARFQVHAAAYFSISESGKSHPGVAFLVSGGLSTGARTACC